MHRYRTNRYMQCETCGDEIPYSTWKKQCLKCYSENNPDYIPRRNKTKKYNPCDGCGGEDCICCSYYHGY